MGKLQRALGTGTALGIEEAEQKEHEAEQNVDPWQRDQLGSCCPLAHGPAACARAAQRHVREQNRTGRVHGHAASTRAAGESSLAGWPQRLGTSFNSSPSASSVSTYSAPSGPCTTSRM